MLSEAQLTLFAAGSLAPISASLDEAQASEARTPDSGGRCSGSSISAGRATRSSRTPRPFALEDWKTSCGPFLRSGLMRSGTVYPLRPLARITRGTGSGLLPTPTAANALQSGRATPRGLIPTPTAGDANSSGSRNTATSKANPGVSLTDWARGGGGRGRMIPTPQASDWKSGTGYSHEGKSQTPQLRHMTGGLLNPRFVEHLMGYPTGFTELEPSEIPSCRKSQRSLGKRSSGENGAADPTK